MMSLFFELFIHGIFIGSMYALIGVSWGLIYSTTKVFHFAHVLTLTLSTYLSIALTVYLGLPFWYGLFFAGAIGGAVGWLVEIGIYQPLRKRNASQLNIFLASVGVLEAGRFTMQLIWGANQVPVRGIPKFSIEIASISITFTQILWVSCTFLLLGSFFIWLKHSRSGYAIQAVATNPYLAASVGVASKKVFVQVFIIGSVMAGVAGYLLSLSYTASLEMGLVPVIAGFTAAFLGGVGNLKGTVYGGLILGLAEQLSGLFLPGEWQTVTAFTLLIIILMLRPQGLFSFR